MLNSLHERSYGYPIGLHTGDFSQTLTVRGCSEVFISSWKRGLISLSQASKITCYGLPFFMEGSLSERSALQQNEKVLPSPKDTQSHTKATIASHPSPTAFSRQENGLAAITRRNRIHSENETLDAQVSLSRYSYAQTRTISGEAISVHLPLNTQDRNEVNHPRPLK